MMRTREQAACKWVLARGEGSNIIILGSNALENYL